MACKTSIEFEADDYFEIFRGDDMVTETILVTPTIAAAWLKRNLGNRPLVERHVDDLVWEMKNGKFRTTPQGLAFNLDEELVDGQHRLTAIVRSGVSIELRVTFNFDGSFDSPIDTGLRLRRAHDILHLSPRDVAVCNCLIALERGPHARGSASKIAEVHAEHREGLAWVAQTFPFQRGITASLMAAHVFAYPVRPSEVAAFAAQFLAHTGSSPNEPAVVLHRFLERSSRATGKGRDMTLAALRCLEAHCKGQTLVRLAATDAGLAYFAEQRAAKGL
jgi:hypothetical protein